MLVPEIDGILLYGSQLIWILVLCVKKFHSSKVLKPVVMPCCFRLLTLLLEDFYVCTLSVNKVF